MISLGPVEVNMHDGQERSKDSGEMDLEEKLLALRQRMASRDVLAARGEDLFRDEYGKSRKDPRQELCVLLENAVQRRLRKAIVFVTFTPGVWRQESKRSRNRYMIEITSLFPDSAEMENDLREWLCGGRFARGEEIEEALKDWLGDKYSSLPEIDLDVYVNTRHRRYRYISGAHDGSYSDAKMRPSHLIVTLKRAERERNQLRALIERQRPVEEVDHNLFLEVKRLHEESEVISSAGDDNAESLVVNRLSAGSNLSLRDRLETALRDGRESAQPAIQFGQDEADFDSKRDERLKREFFDANTKSWEIYDREVAAPLWLGSWVAALLRRKIPKSAIVRGYCIYSYDRPAGAGGHRYWIVVGSRTVDSGEMEREIGRWLSLESCSSSAEMGEALLKWLCDAYPALREIDLCVSVSTSRKRIRGEAGDYVDIQLRAWDAMRSIGAERQESERVRSLVKVQHKLLRGC